MEETDFAYRFSQLPGRLLCFQKMAGDLYVRKAVQGRAQGGGQRQRVAGPRRGGQYRYDRADLELFVKPVSPVGDEGNARSTERFLERGVARARAEQDGDVPVTDGAARVFLFIVNLQFPLHHQLADRGGEAGGLGLAPLLLVHSAAVFGFVSAFFPPDQENGGACGFAVRFQGDIFRLNPFFLDDDARERLVHEIDHAGRAAEVFRDIQHSAIRESTNHLPHFLINGDVRPPEAVDGLLGVAHEKQTGVLQQHPAPVGGVSLTREQEYQLHLQGVGILKLIDQKMPDALANSPAHGSVLPDELRRQEEHVLIGQQTRFAQIPLEGLDETPDERNQTGEHLVGDRRGAFLHEPIIPATEELEVRSPLIGGISPIFRRTHTLVQLEARIPEFAQQFRLR